MIQLSYLDYSAVEGRVGSIVFRPSLKFWDGLRFVKRRPGTESSWASSPLRYSPWSFSRFPNSVEDIFPYLVPPHFCLPFHFYLRISN